MTIDEANALILTRLSEGEECIRSEMISGQDEAANLRASFAEAENALAYLVALASSDPTR